MNELIEIKTNENLEPIISGRELHEKLGVNSHYKDWIKRMLDYGFVENTDYIAIAQKRATAQGNETTYNDHILKLDMAKEICMLQRNEKGKQFRKYFIAVEKDFNSPEKVMARALLFANKKVNLLDVKVKELENKIEQDKPKVIFAEALEVSKTSILIGELAKLLKQNGIDIGANRLFEFLRVKGYLGSKGEYYNIPTQKSMNLGIMEIKTTSTVNSDGSVRTNKTTKITGKGQSYFINIFLKMKAKEEKENK